MFNSSFLLLSISFRFYNLAEIKRMTFFFIFIITQNFHIKMVLFQMVLVQFDIFEPKKIIVVQVE